VILTVYLSDTQQMLTEVPVTPATRVIDVVEYCKEAGEGECHLAEVWSGHERVLPPELLLLDLLQQWGPRRPEVSFYLRHCPAWTRGSLPIETCHFLNANGGAVKVEGEREREETKLNLPRVELTLSELQEMASRQQQQIEAQQQMLIAKEQRLRYLHQGGRSNQAQSQSEAEKLQRLKERVETQEARLKKIRAMRGQVDYSKLINGNLSAEIEHVSSLFQEKQAELQSAVLRVDQLTQQLEDLKRGRLQLHSVSGPAALELRKLYQELQARNRLNLEQSNKLAQNKELLNKRNAQVTVMDQRIEDLRERLHKKRAELSRMNGGGPSSPQTSGVSGRVAAVCPYIQVPAEGRKDAGYPLLADPPQKHTPLSHTRSLSVQPAVLAKVTLATVITAMPGLIDQGGFSIGSDVKQTRKNRLKVFQISFSSKGEAKRGNEAAIKHPCDLSDTDDTDNAPLADHFGAARRSFRRRNVFLNIQEVFLNVPLVMVPTPAPRTRQGGITAQPAPCLALPPVRWAGPAPVLQIPPSSLQRLQQRVSISSNSNQGPAPSSQPSASSPQAERTDPPPAVAVRPYIPDHPSRPQSPRKGPASMNSSSIYSMYLQQPQAKSYGSLSNRTTVKAGQSFSAVYGKPILPSSSASPSPVPFLQGGGGGGVKTCEQDASDGGKGGESGDGAILPPPNVDNIPRPLSPTKLTPVAHSQMRYQSDADLDVLRRRLSNAPRPLKKRSSITEPEGPQGPNIQKLLYQRFNTLAGSMEGCSANTFYQPECILGEADNVGNVDPGDKLAEGRSLNAGPLRSSPPSVVVETPKATTAKAEPAGDAPLQPSSSPAAERPEEQNSDNQRRSSPSHTSVGHGSPSPSPPTHPPLTKVSLRLPLNSVRSLSFKTSSSPPVLQVKRTNLKKPASERTGHGLRVKFNPLALLLDASLEGEFDLVQRIIYEVENPSMPNDEGITPLHNAVCAGHHHIVKFLLDFGVNVNAADSDGWTPLHCAASCNSVHLCKMLVESGAAVFATTISDVETAADKCEEMEEGYAQCSQFLYGVQEKLGVMNKGSVFALWDYAAQHPDELSFGEGDALAVLRRSDDAETEWWWARLDDREGYVPRNLLGLYPRIKPRQRSLA
uniref:Protein phosphatase 1, regulatory subunit 13Ba n=2 Tax=Tetraodon nigroviridis TaxID=99883 RepID=H3CBL1_TETNG